MNERDLPKRITERTHAARKNPRNGSLSEHDLLKALLLRQLKKDVIMDFYTAEGRVMLRHSLETDNDKRFVVEKTKATGGGHDVLKRGTLYQCLRVIHWLGEPKP